MGVEKPRRDMAASEAPSASGRTSNGAFRQAGSRVFNQLRNDLILDTIKSGTVSMPNGIFGAFVPVIEDCYVGDGKSGRPGVRTL